MDSVTAHGGSATGSELANYQLFVERLTGALGLPQPLMQGDSDATNDYVFERHVTFKHSDGSRTNGRIDCYRRNCFVLEAKQSAKRQTQRADVDQFALLPEDQQHRKAGHAKRGTGGWDQVMLAAR